MPRHEPSPELLRAMEAEAPPSLDRLTALKEGAAYARELDASIKDAEERLEGLKSNRFTLLHTTLPDLLDAAGVPARLPPLSCPRPHRVPDQGTCLLCLSSP